METNKIRDNRIDALRTVGLLCIVLAHVNPPAKLFDLRNFDVVCMVMVMSMSYAVSSSRDNFFSYILKRIKRLLLPTWIFLTIFFVVFNVLSQYNSSISFNKEIYIRSYGLFDGIGYVWIIRVYLLIALISPLIKIISNSINNNWVYLLFVIATYYSYELLFYQNYSNKYVIFIVNWYIKYAMGFGVIALLAYRYNKFLNLQKLVIIVGSLLYFLLHIIQNGYISTQTQKYPPRLYFISYGIFVTLLLYELFKLPVLKKMCRWKWVLWISKNSLWLYFWHIIPKYLFAYYDFGILEKDYLIRFLVHLIIAVIFVIIQNFICNKILYYERKKI